MHLLPERIGGAAENMARDFLLLQHPGKIPRFRHYGWRSPAFTFGYSQKIGTVRTSLPPGEAFDLCRRPTGGGIVDHREDWTYTLVVPRGHPFEEASARESYRAVHERLAAAIRAQSVPAELEARGPASAQAGGAGPADVCFQRAEFHDVVRTGSGEKIAGAAQKRNKRGLLLQGTVWRPAVEGASPGPFDWEKFQQDFADRLGSLLGSPAEPTPWPDLDEDELSGLTERYSSLEWMEFR